MQADARAGRLRGHSRPPQATLIADVLDALTSTTKRGGDIAAAVTAVAPVEIIEADPVLNVAAHERHG